MFSKIDNINAILHPEYEYFGNDWEKWRLAYKGGTDFLDRYLKQLTNRETTVDFSDRKAISYCPAFAKAAVNDIKNSIFQRMIDITRVGGPESYKNAIKSLKGGVDRRGSSMNSYLGRFVLPELLTMKKVGVYVDMPPIQGNTYADKGDARPYLYMYRTEDIRSWCYGTSDEPDEFTHVLLRDNSIKTHPDLGLPSAYEERFRFIWKDEDGIHVQFFDDQGEPVSLMGEPEMIQYDLALKRIPFVLFELPTSLMADIADMQVALMNLSSSDMNYGVRSNFPFYVEQFDPRVENIYSKPAGATDGPEATSQDKEIQVGVAHGRRYPLGTDQPAFINPSSEPLKASMDKQEQIKRDIYLAVNLAVTTMNPKMASAESKSLDNSGLESGLSFIGLILETGERQIAEYWAAYEGGEVAEINYPTNYSIKTEEQRQVEAEGKEALMTKIPSDSFKREMAKEIVRITLAQRVDTVKLEKIMTEIDTAPAIISDPADISQDWQNGFVSDETASKLRGYPDGEVEKAKKDRADRLKLIAESQGGEMGQARGIPDAESGVKKTSSAEKKNKPKRGEGKLNE